MCKVLINRFGRRTRDEGRNHRQGGGVGGKITLGPVHQSLQYLAILLDRLFYSGRYKHPMYCTTLRDKALARNMWSFCRRNIDDSN